MDTIISSYRRLSTSFSDLVDKLNTAACYLCGAHHNEAEKLCTGCQLDLSLPESPCPICAERWKGPKDSSFKQLDPCPRCRENPPSYQRCITAFEYDFPVREMIQQLKYGRREYWARALAQAAIPTFRKAFSGMNGVLIPMPVHKQRFIKRGFNQAESLANEISRLSGWPVRNDLCSRQIDTLKQSQLNAASRRQNLALAFSCEGELPDCPLVIIDDVVTTGSTVEALGSALKLAGARSVYVFGFARANRRVSDD